MDHYKLCRLSRAAYESAEEVHDEMLGRYNRHTGYTKQFIDKKTSTTAYVSVNDDLKEIVLVFRGSNDWKDVLMNIRFLKIKTPLNRDIHAGFLSAYKSVEEDINKWIYLEVPSDYSLYVTGHSLGGALATLHTLRSMRPIELTVTFGAPPVGGLNTSKDARYKNIIRYVYGGDIVTRIPKVGYYHGGECRYIMMDGITVLINPSWFTKWKDRWKWGIPVKRIEHHKIDSYVRAFEGRGA